MQNHNKKIPVTYLLLNRDKKKNKHYEQTFEKNVVNLLSNAKVGFWVKSL
jgi:hypothetical protein